MFVKTKIDNAEHTFMIQWMHTPYDPSNPNASRSTICNLYLLSDSDPSSADELEPFAAKALPEFKSKVLMETVKTRCNSADNFSRATGCYLSMTSLLRTLASEGSLEDENVKDFIRTFGKEHHRAMKSALNIVRQKDYFPSKTKKVAEYPTTCNCGCCGCDSFTKNFDCSDMGF